MREGREQARRLVRRGLGGELHGGGAGEEPLQVLRRVAGHEAALGDDEYRLAHGLDLGEDVAAEYDRVLAPEVLYEVADLDYLPGVEAHGGLVEDDDLRVAQQGLGDAHALAIALGEVLYEPVRDVAYLRDGHDALHLLCELGPAQALSVSDEGEIFPRRPVHVERRLLRQIAQQPLRRARLLKDVVPVDPDLA